MKCPVTLYVGTDNQRRDPKPRCIHDEGHEGAHSFDVEVCGKRHGNSIARCERPAGHEKQDALNRKRNLPTTRRQPLKAQSKKQEIIEAKLAGIKEAFIFLTRRFDPDGLRCWNCGRKVREDEVDLHHLRARGQGGEHAARNLELWCREPCHAERHGVPEWSSA